MVDTSKPPAKSYLRSGSNAGMSWTIEGGQGILDLRVIKLSRVWQEVHQRYLVSKPMPVVPLETSKGLQNRQLAA